VSRRQTDDFCRLEDRCPGIPGGEPHPPRARPEIRPARKQSMLLLRLCERESSRCLVGVAATTEMGPPSSSGGQLRECGRRKPVPMIRVRSPKRRKRETRIPVQALRGRVFARLAANGSRYDFRCRGVLPLAAGTLVDMPTSGRRASQPKRGEPLGTAWCAIRPRIIAIRSHLFVPLEDLRGTIAIPRGTLIFSCLPNPPSETRIYLARKMLDHGCRKTFRRT